MKHFLVVLLGAQMGHHILGKVPVVDTCISSESFEIDRRYLMAFSKSLLIEFHKILP